MRYGLHDVFKYAGRVYLWVELGSCPLAVSCLLDDFNEANGGEFMCDFKQEGKLGPRHATMSSVPDTNRTKERMPHFKQLIKAIGGGARVLVIDVDGKVFDENLRFHESKYNGEWQAINAERKTAYSFNRIGG